MGQNVQLLGKMEGWIDENIDVLYRSQSAKNKGRRSRSSMEAMAQGENCNEIEYKKQMDFKKALIEESETLLKKFQLKQKQKQIRKIRKHQSDKESNYVTHV